MPYINPRARELLNDGNKALTAGEINYQISKLLNDYFAMRGFSYDVLNGAIGALECAKLECYRRLAAPYEDKKIGENGDVYVFQKTEA